MLPFLPHSTYAVEGTLQLLRQEDGCPVGTAVALEPPTSIGAGGTVLSVPSLFPVSEAGLHIDQLELMSVISCALS